MINTEAPVAPLGLVQRQRLGLSPWQVLVVAGLILLLYYSILAKLGLDWWQDPNFSHGFFVPLFSAFLIWQKWEVLQRTPLNPSWWGIPIIVSSLAELVVGRFGVELFLQRTSLVFLLAGIVVSFLGWRLFREMLFPWIYLFLMIPIPAIIFNQIAFPLQLFASQLATAVLPLLGVPVLREGNVIHLPAMPLEVAEACSGIRSLLSLVALTIIYAYFMESRFWKRLLLIVASVPIAIAANASRVVVTGLMVQYWDPDKALGFLHEFSGWAIFMFSGLLLLGFHICVKNLLPDRRQSEPRP